ncbi:MAG: class I SAM-dependent methyltransferase [Proteobacteria bacterium]|nr:class I SAM-dependent methyltransferase [Pseudomonadota bacterium]
MKQAVLSRLPDQFVKTLRGLKRGRSANRPGRRSHDQTAYPPASEPGPLISEVFDLIKNLPGWFTIDDCVHFYLVLSLQSAYGIEGDLFEIGSYYGRSTAMMAYCLRPGEKIVICDAFDLEIEDHYNQQPGPGDVIDNIQRVNPELMAGMVEIHACLSSDMVLADDRRFRFIHIDGGHSQDAAMNDLLLCRKHVLPGGVMVVDDYHNPDWPGVTQAVDAFLAANADFTILADLNRHGAVGRKIYLQKQPT